MIQAVATLIKSHLPTTGDKSTEVLFLKPFFSD